MLFVINSWRSEWLCDYLWRGLLLENKGWLLLVLGEASFIEFILVSCSWWRLLLLFLLLLTQKYVLLIVNLILNHTVTCLIKSWMKRLLTYWCKQIPWSMHELLMINWGHLHLLLELSGQLFVRSIHSWCLLWISIVITGGSFPIVSLGLLRRCAHLELRWLIVPCVSLWFDTATIMKTVGPTWLEALTTVLSCCWKWYSWCRGANSSGGGRAHRRQRHRWESSTPTWH